MGPAQRCRNLDYRNCGLQGGVDNVGLLVITLHGAAKEETEFMKALVGQISTGVLSAIAGVSLA